MTRVGFAGMTHLGLVSAVATAAKGFAVVGYDADSSLVAALSAGRLPVFEPQLDDLVRDHGDRLNFTADVAALADCDVVYVAPDIPTDDEGRSDVSAIRALIDRVAPVLKPDAVMVVLSQVEPGFTRALPAPEPTRRYYQVETLVFGRAVERALQPERFIVGCADPAAPLPPAFASVLGAFGCPVLPMRYESAELAKIAINCCLVSSVSVANTLAELCEAIGADWAEIVPALKLDKRIGPHAYLKPGLGIAGGNLERDLATVERIAAAHGADAGVVSAWKANSRHRRDWALQTIRRVVLDAHPRATLAVWGLAYKENTRSIKNSPSLATLAQLPEDVTLRLHDPMVEAGVVARASAQGFAQPLDALDGANALMILTPWPEYTRVSPRDIAARLAGRVVLDPYAVLDGNAVTAAGLTYYTLGRGVNEPRRGGA
ncbi:nucleotide sugar dehydrogenase [Rhodopseudomonas sp. B29]|uniref:nucleotide sugar dehydrogenase n=1 Tax=Rhodopseudomonas sp. B29 TaxID=95607 RepID=UPI0003496B1F|nr:nucleotide sugar dehydrogenase [Rhodopseudomonas sp. B29]